MRIVRLLSCAGAVVLAVGLLAGPSASDASTASVDLGITGGTVTGYTVAPNFQVLPVSFTMTNHSHTTSATVDFTFSLTNATASGADYVCATTDHTLISPDTPNCEPGWLRPGQRVGAAILVTPTISSGTVSVRACAGNENNYPDPVAANNCKTVRIRIE